MSTFFQSYACDQKPYVCIIEDDERVAYAYLVFSDKIIGDVWLYNQASTPENPEWKGRSKMPFLNSRKYVSADVMITPLKPDSDIKVVWEFTESGQLRYVTILVNLIEYARLAPGAKPGWSAAVAIDGPLARKLASKKADLKH